MSPSRSKTIVFPSADTSTDTHVPSLTSNATVRPSGRGLLMSAAASGFFPAAAAASGLPKEEGEQNERGDTEE